MKERTMAEVARGPMVPGTYEPTRPCLVCECWGQEWLGCFKRPDGRYEDRYRCIGGCGIFWWIDARTGEVVTEDRHGRQRRRPRP
jgi:hypothetical protein